VLFQQFLNGSFEEAEEFAKTYDKIFLSEPGMMEKRLFDILEKFWEDVDAYSPLWEPEDINGFHITEELLREEARDALEKLEKYLKQHPD
jgi:hypothetical protein